MQQTEERSIVDLHTHSTASDGVNHPAELVALAARRGLRFLGLTDHDSTQGIDEAVSAGEAEGITVIPGVELGTDVPAGELHMLGYYIDHRETRFQQVLSDFREGRQQRAGRIVRQLSDIGIDVDLAAIQRSVGEGSIGRAHIARALIDTGQASSMDDAFTRYLSRGRPGYVARPRLTPEEAVALIHQAGGVAVLAHPFTVDDLDSLLPSLVQAGLDGLEVFYAAYAREQRLDLLRRAERFGLIPTGGSDFHGVGEREERSLGSAPVPLETVSRLQEVANQRLR